MEQTELLRRVISVLDGLDITYMVVGSFASGSYGEPRLTMDIDIVVELSAGDVPRLCQAFPSPEYYVSLDAAIQAVRSGSQFNVIHPTSGNKIDFMVAGTDAWGRMQVSRRRRVHLLPDLDAYTAAPEDVILSKMAYYREGGSEKHLRDITGILNAGAEDIDEAYVVQWAERLGLAEIWQAILRRLGAEGEDGG